MEIEEGSEQQKEEIQMILEENPKEEEDDHHQHVDHVVEQKVGYPVLPHLHSIHLHIHYELLFLLIHNRVHEDGQQQTQGQWI